MESKRIGVLLIFGLLNACATQPCPQFDRYTALKEGVDPYLSDDITPEGVEHLQCMAARGNKRAQFRLGYALENGIGIEKDLSEAATWYRTSAADIAAANAVYQASDGRMKQVGPQGMRQYGLPEARYALALLYLHGKGVEPDRKKAIRLLNKAADSGHADARELLQQIDPR